MSSPIITYTVGVVTDGTNGDSTSSEIVAWELIESLAAPGIVEFVLPSEGYLMWGHGPITFIPSPNANTEHYNCLDGRAIVDVVLLPTPPSSELWWRMASLDTL